MSDDKTSEDEEPKKGKPLVLIIVLVNVLLGGGAGAFFFMRGGDPPPPAAKGDHAGDHGEGGDHGGGDHGGGDHGEAAPPREAGKIGPIVAFESVVVNLNEPEGTRYLKASIGVQLVSEKVASEVEKFHPVVLDHFVRDLSDLTFRQTMGNKNKLAIKRRLLKRFNEAVGTEAAVEVHLTQFIVQ